jgi:DNA-binding response OmpR family regulator
MPKKILIIEDNVDTRDLIHLHLTTEGFAVVVAADGREGLYMAEAERPDLIITDIDMPNLDGIELVKRLRAQEQFQGLPILVLTSFGKEQMEEAILAGANRAVGKPAHFDSLIEDVTELLAESKREKDR